MSAELWALLSCALIMLVSLLIQAVHLDFIAGIKYGLSSRDSAPTTANEMSGRLRRNVQNQLEGLAVFVPLVVIAVAVDASSSLTEGTALVYAASRLVFVPCYLFNLSPYRSIIWIVGLLAQVGFITGLFQAVGFPGS